jgi:hemerythrin-like domain-containing protein
MTTPTTTPTASDPWEMALVHRLVRRGFDQSRELVLADGSAARADAIARYVDFHLVGLHAHHSSEDDLLWPALRERAGMSDALIGRMEDQHVGLHAAIEAIRTELAAWVAAPSATTTAPLATALGTMSELLGAHLAEEERDVVPLIATHITQAEWDNLGKVAFSKFTPKQRFTAMGELLSTANADEAARMFAGLPAPVKVVWRLIGRRKYDRFMAEVRGSSPAG